MRLLVLAGVVLAVTAARADVRYHAEASAFAGPVWASEKGNGVDESHTSGLLDVRGALGLSWRSASGIIVRGGAVLDVFTAGSSTNGAALGIELQADTEIAEWPGWRIGGRLAGSLGDGGKATEAGEGQLLVPGVRLRKDFGFVGVDAILVRGGDSERRRSANAFVFGAGVIGKPAVVVIGIGGVIAGIVGIVAYRALRNTH